MTFLKKLGQILGAISGISSVVGPIVQPFLGSGKAATVAGTVTNDLTAMGSAIAQIETAFGAVAGSTGAQKLQASIPLIGNIIKTSELVVGKKIANESLFTQAIQEYAQATADLLNSIDQSEAKSA